MPIASFKTVREVSSEDAAHVADNLLRESAGKKWRTKSGNEKSAYVILEFQEPQQITGIDIGNEHSAFIEVLVSRSGCQPDDFRELLLSSSFMTPIESKNSSNQNRVRCFSGPALDQTALPEKWKLLKIVCTQPFNRHVQYGISFVKVHVVAAAPTASAAAAPAKVKSLLPERMMQFGAFKLREESPDSESDNQLTRFQSWKKESLLKQQQQQQPPAATTTAAAIRDAESTALRRLSIGKVSANLPKPSPNPSPVPTARRSESSDGEVVKPLDRNRASLLFGEDDGEDNDQDADENNAKKRRLSKHLEADKDRRRQEQEKEKERKKEKTKRHSLDRSSSNGDKSISKENKSSVKEDKPARKEEIPSSKDDKPAKRGDKHEDKHRDVSKSRDNPRPSAQKRLSSPTANRASATPAKRARIKDPVIHYRPFNQLLNGVVLVISGIQNPDRADLRAKATALGAKYKADWEPGCTHLICAFKNTPKYNQVKGKGKIVTRSWIEKCYDLRKYLPWRRYALNTMDLGQPESDEELCDEARKPSSRRESKESIEMEDDETIKVANTYDVDPKDQNKVSQNEEASSGIDTEDELERVADENRKKKAKLKTPVKTKSEDDIYDVSTEEEDYLVEKKKQMVID